MENMIRFLIFMLTLGLFGCALTTNPKNIYNLSKKEDVVNEILANTAACLKKDKNLIPFGSGGQMMQEVKMLELAFIYNKPITIEEGRKLLVYAVETFVSMINSDERIRPYLYSYPFEPKNVEVTIVIKNTNCSSVPPGKFCLVTQIKGDVTYYADGNKYDPLKVLHKETFTEAQNTVNEKLIQLKVSL